MWNYQLTVQSCGTASLFDCDSERNIHYMRPETNWSACFFSALVLAPSRASFEIEISNMYPNDKWTGCHKTALHIINRYCSLSVAMQFHVEIDARAKKAHTNRMVLCCSQSKIQELPFFLSLMAFNCDAEIVLSSKSPNRSKRNRFELFDDRNPNTSIISLEAQECIQFECLELIRT